MKANYINIISTTLLTGIVLLTNQALANEDYDVRAFGPKSPIVWEKPVKVVFEHRTHTDAIGLDCAACHSEIFAMQRGVAARTGKLNMASLAEGKFCGSCHDGETAFASNSNCNACHIVPEDPIVWTKPVKAVVFYHQKHTDDYGLDCDSCHSEAFSMKKGAAEQSGNFTMQALYDGKYCGSCHDGETAFASNTLCNTCHIGTKGYNRMMGTDPHAAVKDAHGSGH